jgi:hypothetical protein
MTPRATIDPAFAGNAWEIRVRRRSWSRPAFFSLVADTAMVLAQGPARHPLAACGRTSVSPGASTGSWTWWWSASSTASAARWPTSPGWSSGLCRSNPSVINPRLPVALGKERPKPLHLRVRQPEEIAHGFPRLIGGHAHPSRRPASRSMGPEPWRMISGLAFNQLNELIFFMNECYSAPCPPQAKSV